MDLWHQFGLAAIVAVCAFAGVPAVSAGGGADPAGGVRLVREAVDASAGGVPCYRIETPAATYYLEKVGAGLSSMVDADGNDWIGFRKAAGSGAGGEYRGFPNAVHQQDGSYFHPMNAETDASKTRVVHEGSARVTIEATSGNGAWQGLWDFYPSHCTFTMVRMARGYAYWVLYEGTPGGAYDDSDWWMTSAVKQKRIMTDVHEGDIAGPEWIAFGDSKLNRCLFLLHHEDDTHPDRFYAMDKKMTVFGFGRDGLTKHLASTPQRFSIGFAEGVRHEDVARRAEAILRAEGQRRGGRAPVIYCTDLFHPHVDPDDHFDIACLYAMPEIDLRAVILDQGKRQEERPGSVAVSQLNAITGRNVPYAAGLADRLESPEDKGLGQPAEHQAGVELIVSILEASSEPVTIVAVGSLRDVAAAFNRAPGLFEAKVDRLLIFIGEASLAGHVEYNVGLDTHAYVRIMHSGLPVYWVPCFDGGLWRNKGNASYWKASHSDLLGDVSQRVMNYFVYALRHKKERDPVEYLDRKAGSEDIAAILQMDRNLWCSAVFPSVAGRQFVRRDNAVTAVPAGESFDGAQTVEPFAFEEVSIFVDAAGTVLYEDTDRSSKVKRFRVTDLDSYAETMTAVTAQLLRDLDVPEAVEK